MAAGCFSNDYRDLSVNFPSVYTPDFLAPLSWIVLTGSILGALVLVLFRARPGLVSSCILTFVVILILWLLCAAPFAWSCTLVLCKGEGNMPSAGPVLVSDHRGFQGMGPDQAEGNSSAQFSYLVSHQAGEKYLVGVESSRSAGDLIISYGAPVMIMGGFSGSDQILTNQSLMKLIHEGKIRYFLSGQEAYGIPGREGV